MSNYPSIYPAVVKAYDPVTRTCRVDIPQITTGGDVYPVAEVAYPIGDKPKGVHATEIEILPNDMVWVEFINSDPRHPVITGWRNPKTGNVNGVRHWHHAKITINADTNIESTAQKHIFTGDIEITGNFKATGGSFLHNGVNVGSSHQHSNVQPGSGNSGPPVGGGGGSGGGGGGGSGIATGDGAAAGTYLSGIA